MIFEKSQHFELIHLHLFFLNYKVIYKFKIIISFDLKKKILNEIIPARNLEGDDDDDEVALKILNDESSQKISRLKIFKINYLLSMNLILMLVVQLLRL